MSALAIASIIMGSVISLTNLPGLLSPKLFAAWLTAFPRHKKIGCILMGINAVWLAGVVFTGEYGDIWVFRESIIRASVFVLAPIVFFVVVRYADQYLAARGLGILLLLAGKPLLTAAFVEDTVWRLVLTVTTYVWIVAGIIFVASPYRLRDLIAWMIETSSRMRVICAIRLGLGLLLLFLGFAVY